MLAVLGLTLAWPALWHTGLRFRTANTRWRGLSAGHTGRLAGTHGAVAPSLVPFAGHFGLEAVDHVLAELGGCGCRLVPFGSQGLVVVAALAWPWSSYRLRRYGQDHLVLGPMQLRHAAGGDGDHHHRRRRGLDVGAAFGSAQRRRRGGRRVAAGDGRAVPAPADAA